MRGLRRIQLIVVVLIGTLGATVGASVPPAAAATEGKLVMVLDSSGSMKEKVGGQSKISVAKASLQAVIGKLPADAPVGLRVYGATVFDKSDRGACTDSQLVVPIGTGNRAQLRSQVDKYRPYGETPISYSLLQAAKDLGDGGKRTILLVSDGEETCDADPCEISDQIAKRGIDLKIDVVGLAVSGKVRDQLRCIADKGRGTYYDADDRDDLQDSLDKLATRAFRPFRVTGTPVKGTTSRAAAPTIGPGQYVDTVPTNSKRLYYRIHRTVAGSTLRVGFTALVTTARGRAKIGTVKPTLYGTTTRQCGKSFLSQGITVVGSTPLVGAEADSWEQDPESPCARGDLLLEIFTYDLGGRPFELLVAEEPPVSDPGSATEATVSWLSMKGLGTARAVPVPGTSFSDAAALTQGRYRGRILSGENQVFAVQAGWGQRVQVEVILPPRTGALAREMGSADNLDVQLFGAMRGEYFGLPVVHRPQWSSIVGTASRTYRRGATSATVRYLNRLSGGREHAASIPGPQYLSLGMSRNLEGKSYLVPYELRVRVIGKAGTGAPTYVQLPPSTPSPTLSPTPSPISSPSATEAQSSSASPTESAREGQPVWLLLAVGAGAAALGVGATVGVTSWRRRRAGSHSA